MKKDRSDFRNWLFGKVDWKEVLFQINTGQAHQTKQGKTAIFWNSYIYIQQKFEAYFQEFNKVPMEVFEKLIFEFRQSFPKSGRAEGVNYFDDLIEQLIERYRKSNSKDYTNRKKALNQLSDNEINDYRNLLLKESVLVEVGENPNRIGNEKFSASQIIALVIKEISSSKNIPQQTVFEQVKPIWKLTKKELKNYKVPEADNPKLGDYEGFVDSILTKVP